MDPNVVCGCDYFCLYHLFVNLGRGRQHNDYCAQCNVCCLFKLNIKVKLLYLPKKTQLILLHNVKQAAQEFLVFFVVFAFII